MTHLTLILRVNYSLLGFEEHSKEVFKSLIILMLHTHAAELKVPDQYIKKIATSLILSAFSTPGVSDSARGVSVISGEAQVKWVITPADDPTPQKDETVQINENFMLSTSFHKVGTAKLTMTVIYKNIPDEDLHDHLIKNFSLPPNHKTHKGKHSWCFVSKNPNLNQSSLKSAAQHMCNLITNNDYPHDQPKSAPVPTAPPASTTTKQKSWFSRFSTRPI